MRENGTYRDHKIGRILQDVNGEVSVISGVPGYTLGQVILFREELEPSDSQLCLGEYRGMKQKLTGRVTIESPMCQSEIDSQRKNGSPLKTIGTMVGVPKSYIEEIKI